ncbi:MAG: hypothetical protein ACQEW0_00730 [Pseudomonadota bacterium]
MTRCTYSTEADALDAAYAGWQRIQRGVAEFELTLAARLIPVATITTQG